MVKFSNFLKIAKLKIKSKAKRNFYILLGAILTTMKNFVRCENQDIFRSEFESTVETITQLWI